MNTNQKFSEGANVTVGVIPAADIDTSDVDSASGLFVSMQDYRRVVGIGVCEGPGTTKKLTVTLLQATDATGAGKKALGTAAVATAVSTEALEAVAEANVEDMDHANGFLFVGLRVGTDKGTAVDGGGILVRDQGRFSE
jgi:hypothetical protein